MNELVGVVYLAMFRDQDVTDFETQSPSPSLLSNEDVKSADDVFGMREAMDYNVVFSGNEKDIEAGMCSGPLARISVCLYFQ